MFGSQRVSYVSKAASLPVPLLSFGQGHEIYDTIPELQTGYQLIDARHKAYALDFTCRPNLQLAL